MSGDLLPITLAEEIAELQRELAMRHRVYPRRIAAGQMKQHDADRYVARMHAAMTRLQGVEAALHAVLLFHSGEPWTEARREDWLRLTRSEDATTKTLCNTVRLALGKIP